MDRWRGGVALAWGLFFAAMAFGALMALRFADSPGRTDEAFSVVALGISVAGLVFVPWRLAEDSRQVRALTVEAGRLADALSELCDELRLGSKRADRKGVEKAAELARPLLDELRGAGQETAARELSRSIAGVLREVRRETADGDPRQGHWAAP